MNNKISNFKYCAFEELDVMERYAAYDLDQTGEDWEFDITSGHQVAIELNALSTRAFHPTDR